MAKTYEQIKQLASEIRDERIEGANTAQRIGQVLGDIIDYVETNKTSIDTKLDISSSNPVQNRVITTELNKISAGGGNASNRLLLDVSPRVVYTDRETKVEATATLINHVGVISLQADKAMQVFSSVSSVRSYNHAFTVTGSDTIRAVCEDAGERLEAVCLLQAVNPIFFGQAMNADELSQSQVAPPRETPAGSYAARIEANYSFCLMIPHAMGKLNPSKVRWNGLKFPLAESGVYEYKGVSYDMYESGSFREATDVLIIIDE